MCTLAVAAKIVPGLPLVIVANRDEEKRRPSRPPFRWDGFVAPRDERAGGTWLGWNDHGVFVGITNRFGAGTADPRGRALSRGRIVVEALDGSSAAEIHERMSKLDPKDYPGFHLVYADAKDVMATVSNGREKVQLILGGGLSVVTERSFGAGASRGSPRDPVDREGRVRRAWASIVATGDRSTLPSRLTRLLTEHDDVEPLGATCVHYDAYDYGTRSAMVLAVDDQGSATMLWAEGPPCTTPFFPVPTDVPRD
jgi:uncharacterized protein with NRDE domain